MSDKNIALLTLGLSAVALLVTLKIAMGLQKAQEDIDKTIGDVKASPVGGLAKALGFGGF